MSNFETLIQNYDRACNKVENTISMSFNFSPEEMIAIADQAETAGNRLLEGLPEMNNGEKTFAIQMLSTYQSSIAFLRYLATEGD